MWDGVQPINVFLVPLSTRYTTTPVVGALSMGPSLSDEGSMVLARTLRLAVLTTVRKQFTRSFATADVDRESGSTAFVTVPTAISTGSAILATLGTPVHALILGMMFAPLEGLWLGTR